MNIIMYFILPLLVFHYLVITAIQLIIEKPDTIDKTEYFEYIVVPSILIALVLRLLIF